eukprot:COSAG05_NODE_1834_length_3997_cov_127.609131_4_plen_173_part_00
MHTAAARDGAAWTGAAELLPDVSGAGAALSPVGGSGALPGGSVCKSFLGTIQELSARMQASRVHHICCVVRATIVLRSIAFLFQANAVRFSCVASWSEFELDLSQVPGRDATNESGELALGRDSATAGAEGVHTFLFDHESVARQLWAQRVVQTARVRSHGFTYLPIFGTQS